MLWRGYPAKTAFKSTYGSDTTADPRRSCVSAGPCSPAEPQVPLDRVEIPQKRRKAEAEDKRPRLDPQVFVPKLRAAIGRR